MSSVYAVNTYILCNIVRTFEAPDDEPLRVKERLRQDDRDLVLLAGDEVNA